MGVKHQIKRQRFCVSPGFHRVRLPHVLPATWLPELTVDVADKACGSIRRVAACCMVEKLSFKLTNMCQPQEKTWQNKQSKQLNNIKQASRSRFWNALSWMWSRTTQENKEVATLCCCCQCRTSKSGDKRVFIVPVLCYFCLQKGSWSTVICYHMLFVMLYFCWDQTYIHAAKTATKGSMKDGRSWTCSKCSAACFISLMTWSIQINVFYSLIWFRTWLQLPSHVTCCLLPLRVSMTNCMVSEMSDSASPMHCCPPPPFFSWLFSCRGIATSSWCTFTVSPLRCCRDRTRRSGKFLYDSKHKAVHCAHGFPTCRFSSIILSRAWMKSSSSAQATCFSPPPRIVTSYTQRANQHDSTDKSLN